MEWSGIADNRKSVAGASGSALRPRAYIGFSTPVTHSPHYLSPKQLIPSVPLAILGKFTLGGPAQALEVVGGIHTTRNLLSSNSVYQWFENTKKEPYPGVFHLYRPITCGT